MKKLLLAIIATFSCMHASDFNAKRVYGIPAPRGPQQRLRAVDNPNYVAPKQSTWGDSWRNFKGRATIALRSVDAEPKSYEEPKYTGELYSALGAPSREYARPWDYKHRPGSMRYREQQLSQQAVDKIKQAQQAQAIAAQQDYRMLPGSTAVEKARRAAQFAALEEQRVQRGIQQAQLAQEEGLWARFKRSVLPVKVGMTPEQQQLGAARYEQLGMSPEEFNMNIPQAQVPSWSERAASYASYIRPLPNARQQAALREQQRAEKDAARYEQLGMNPTEFKGLMRLDADRRAYEALSPWEKARVNAADYRANYISPRVRRAGKLYNQITEEFPSAAEAKAYMKQVPSKAWQAIQEEPQRMRERAIERKAKEAAEREQRRALGFYEEE
jgi:hypothetical protein